MAETHPYNQVIPYTDRLNYCSAPMNNIGFCKAVEDLMGVQIPPKAQAIRVILCELSRIIDHIVCTAANAVDLGALTGFFHLFTYREKSLHALRKTLRRAFDGFTDTRGWNGQRSASGLVQGRFTVR